jgi:hypothetical protein
MIEEPPEPERLAALPPLYSGWLDEVLAGPIPAETEATCDNCAMCEAEGEHLEAEHFNPRTKCCTYLPELPNFLVGRILADTDTHPAAVLGRKSVEARLAAGAAVTPLGLGRARPYALLYKSSTDAFGHALSMRCPHYVDSDGGLCGVWKNRMSMCATWFCKHVRGAVGAQFWKSVHRLLNAAERSVSAWCVAELDPGRDALERLFRVHNGTAGDAPLTGFELDGGEDPETYRVLWGSWRGKEAEFYRACADRVNALAWKDVLALSGPEVRIGAQLVKQAYADLRSQALPEVLRIGPFQVVASDAESMRVCTYNGYDPLELPRALVDLLPRFDGRPVRTVLETIATGDGIELEDALVRKLVDFKILESPAK